MFRKMLPPILSLLLMALSGSTPLQAQTAPGPAASTNTLDAIVVTADRAAETRREVTANITVIDRKMIERLPVDNVGALLGQLGFQYREYPGTLSNVGVRGFKTEAHGNDLMGGVLVLLNGRRFGSSNLGKVATTNVERIEVIRGPAAVQYGSAALGGVINIITKKGEGPLTASLEVGAGSYDLTKTMAGLNWAANNFDFSMGYTFARMGNDYETAKGDRYTHSQYDSKQSLNMDLGYTFLDKHRLGVNFNYYKADNSESPGAFYLIDLGTQSWSVTDKSNNAVDFTYSGATEDDSWSWSGRYTLGRDKETTYRETTRTYSGYNIVNSDMAQAQVTHDAGLFRLTAGYDYVKYDLSALRVPKSSEYTDSAGFLLGKLRLFDESLIISAGGRYDYYKVSLDELSGTQSASEKHFTPSAGLAYSPVDWLKFRLNYAEAFLMPTARQLAGDYNSGIIHFAGNPDLKPETSETWEIGVDFSWDNFFAAVTYFHTDSENMITTKYLNANNATYQNLGKAERAGLEFEVNTDVAALLDWDFELRPYLNLTYMTTYKDRDTGKKLKDIPKMTAGYGVTFFEPEYDLTATLNFSYMGKQEITKWGGPSGSTNLGESRLCSSTVASLALKKNLFNFDDHGKVDLKVDVNNLFNKYYESVSNYPAPGRNFYVGLHYSY